MKFTDITKINTIDAEKGLIDLEIGVELDATIDPRWELVDPKVWVACQNDDEIKLESMELIDEGMAVHGYEFEEKDRQAILKLIDEKLRK